jgi:hypothetical protein
MKLYQMLAQIVDARLRCQRDGNIDWFGKHTHRLFDLMKQYLPSGSGFDNGTKLDLDKSNADKLVFATDFHHMNDTGYYVGWTSHRVVVTPSLGFGFTLRVTGRDKNNIKDYIAESFEMDLNAMVEE